MESRTVSGFFVSRRPAGYLPARNGHSGHFTASQRRTSATLPHEQSRHLAGMACSGRVRLSWPAARVTSAVGSHAAASSVRLVMRRSSWLEDRHACGTGCGGIFMRPSPSAVWYPLPARPAARRFYFVSTMRHSPAAPSRFGNSPNSVLPSRPAVMAVWQSNFAISLEGATSAGVANEFNVLHTLLYNRKVSKNALG